MEITPQMSKCRVDPKARYCPYCCSPVNTHYGDDRYKCKVCDREYYILRYESEVEDGN